MISHQSSHGETEGEIFIGSFIETGTKWINTLQSRCARMKRVKFCVISSCFECRIFCHYDLSELLVSLGYAIFEDESS